VRCFCAPPTKKESTKNFGLTETGQSVGEETIKENEGEVVVQTVGGKSLEQPTENVDLLDRKKDGGGGPKGSKTS